MRSYLSKWVIERITAILLIPLTLWFVYNCVLFSKSSYNDLILFFGSYRNSLLFLLMMVSMLIHAKLGFETIIIDYVSSKKIKTFSIFIVNIIFYLAIFVSLISVFMIMP